MNKRLIILIFMAVIARLGAQSCLPNGILITSQSQIDNFATNYPNCTVIQGNVTIQSPFIANLNGLSVITSIGGNLRILDCSGLTNLTGLSGLSQIGGGLQIFGNLNLSSLSGMSNLEKIGSYLTISGNGNLTNVGGLTDLVYLGGSLNISDNGKLTSIGGLSGLKAIGGSISISSNASLSSLTGLSNVASVGGYVNLSNNDALTSLSGLGKITGINGYLRISGHAKLSNISALGQINPQSVKSADSNADLTIMDNSQLSSCAIATICGILFRPGVKASIQNNGTGCQSVPEVSSGCSGCPTGDVSFGSQQEIDQFATTYPNCTKIEGNVTIQSPFIANLNGLSAITTIDGNLKILGCSALTNLSGLSKLTFIRGGLQIYNNLNLSLLGLNELSYLGSYLTISGNANLTKLYSLAKLGSVKGSLTISDNGKLTRLEGLQGLKVIEGNLSIASNAKLNTLDFLGNVSAVHGNLSLDNNDALTSLNGLGRITSIIGYLRISGNAKLADISDLAQLIPKYIQSKDNNEDLEIVDNPQLSACAIASICGTLQRPGVTTNIQNNGAGCQSTAQVKAACPDCPPGDLMFSNQNMIDNFVAAYPNCTQVEGDLHIINGVTDLSGLSKITRIGGNLYVHVYTMTSLSGLDGLTNVEGNVDIDTNEKLITLEGLSNLSTIGGDLKIYINRALTNLNGLKALSNIGGSLQIEDNTDLKSLSGLSNLNAVGGRVSIASNSTLTSLDGLGKLTSFGGNLLIYHNGALSNLNGLVNLRRIGGSLEILKNGVLTDISGIADIDPSSIQSSSGPDPDLLISANPQLSECAVASICEALVLPGTTTDIHDNAMGCNTADEIQTTCINCPIGNVTFNSQLEIDDFLVLYPNCTQLEGKLIINGGDISDLSGISQIEVIGDDLRIYSCDALLSLTGLSGLTQIPGDVRITNNDKLNSLEGLTNIVSISGELKVTSNNALTSLNGLGNLTSIGGSLTLTDNANIKNLNGLSLLNSIGGDLYIHNNVALTSLDGLEMMTSLGGRFEISKNEALTSLEALSNLTNINGVLGILENGSLPNLIGLENIGSISGLLLIAGNNILTDINGIANIDPHSIKATNSSYPDLSIYDNPQLSECAVASICGKLLLPGSTSDIHDNALGCNTAAEIQKNCILCPAGDLILRTQQEVNNFPSTYPNCTYIVGDLTLMGSNITNLNGLAQLNYIGGDLTIRDNNSLTSIKGLHNLASLGGSLGFYNNAKLNSLADLKNLRYIGGAITIDGNNALSSLTGLDKIAPNSIHAAGNNPDLTIINNSVLSLCEVASICDLLLLPGTVTNIHDNATGCNSQIQIATACAPVVCPQGDLVFSTQQQINNFAINYPTCSDLPGNVTISGNNITNLSGLAKLQRIGGNLVLNNNRALIKLDGLKNLISIGGLLDISNNDALTSLSGLEKLAAVGGAIFIEENDALINLNGIQNIDPATIQSTDTSPDLTISGNALLGGCAIVPVCQVLKLPGSTVKITNNASGCNSISEINLTCSNTSCPTGDLVLTSQQQIDHYAIDFPNCSVLSGNLTISGSDITSLVGLAGIFQIDGALILANLDSLDNLNGLENLKSIGSFLGFYNNDALVNLQGLEGLTRVGGTIALQGNDGLLSLNGLDHIDPATIKSTNTFPDLIITDNAMLSECAIENVCKLLALPGVTTDIQNNASGCQTADQVIADCNDPSPCLQGDFYFSSQQQVDEFKMDFGNCTEIPGNITINGADITNLDGLININTINGNLLFTENPSLVNINGLNNLRKIDGFLRLYGNDALGNLDGLENLTNLSGSISIEYNNALTSLSGLQNIDPTTIAATDVFEDLILIGNPKLSDCEVASICRFLDIPSKTSVVFDNAQGCNSTEEISAGCLVVSVLNLSSKPSIKIYPNPATDQLHLIGITTGEIRIFDILGRTIQSQTFDQPHINLSGIAAGSYLIQINHNGQRLGTAKLIKK